MFGLLGVLQWQWALKLFLGNLLLVADLVSVAASRKYVTGCVKAYNAIELKGRTGKRARNWSLTKLAPPIIASD